MENSEAAVEELQIEEAVMSGAGLGRLVVGGGAARDEDEGKAKCY